MEAVNIYLNFNGNTEEAFNFYRSVFGGDFPMVMRMKDVPGDEEIPEELQDKIMHIGLKIGPNTYLMGSDAIESMGPKITFGNNSHIYLQCSTKEEADELFKKLSVDGKIEMPMADQFWGDYFGNFTDKFGVNWMISKESESYES